MRRRLVVLATGLIWVHMGSNNYRVQRRTTMYVAHTSHGKLNLRDLSKRPSRGNTVM